MIAVCALIGAAIQYVSDEFAEHWYLLEEIRNLLAHIPKRVSPLRVGPTVEEEEEMRVEVEAFRDAYKTGGVAAAKNAMRKNNLGFFFRDHLEWVASERIKRDDV